MKKPLYIFSLLILLVVAFVAGNRFNQRGAGQGTASTGERQILHYVDPMDPTHITKEPGIAPCGMPMEPVYADDDTLPGDTLPSTSLGTVKINPQKQQIIGVQIGEVTKSAETYIIRALGRIAADENQIYTLTAATDGWVGEIHESTTGSLVDKNQLMARIKIFDFDFYTWQRRHLAELSDLRRKRTHLPSSFRGDKQMEEMPIGRQAGSSRAETATPAAMPHADAPLPAPTPSPPGDMLSMETPPSSPGTGEIPSSATMGAISPPENAQTGSQDNSDKDSGVMNKHPTPAEDARRKTEMRLGRGSEVGLGLSAIDNIFYSNRSRLELLDLGVGESQLAEFEKSGVYIMSAELRSPVRGLVLSRNISPKQKIDRGTECFRIADLSTVWVDADLYDSEAKYIRPGTQARVSMPGQKAHLAAKVSEVLPRFDAASRTLKVRLEMDNPGNTFRPDMFVDVEFLVELPESIAVPSGALIDSGKSKVVYVVVEDGVFEPRAVVTGWRWGDRVEIVEGLKAGEKIVVSGNFLIDSESRMKLAAARLMEEKTKKPPDAQVPAGQAAPEAKVMQPAAQKAATAEQAKDPVCGMTVDPENARTAGLFAEVQGKTYYFCSEECKEEFHRHGPQPGISTGTDLEPEASTGRGTQETDAKHAMPGDASTMQEPQHSPEKQMPADAAGEHGSMPSAPSEPQTAPHAIAADSAKPTVKDPVCGMAVDPEKAMADGLTAEVQGKTYYFCSEECKEEFHRHGPQPGTPAGADPGPEASSGHGTQGSNTMPAEPKDTPATPEPQHSPVDEAPAEGPGAGGHDHD